jgi:hypothetical protein
VSTEAPASVRRNPWLARAGYAFGGFAWAVLCYALLAGDPSSRDACASSVYRDPVTGRMAGMGDVRALPDGRILCPRR